MEKRVYSIFYLLTQVCKSSGCHLDDITSFIIVCISSECHLDVKLAF